MSQRPQAVQICCVCNKRFLKKIDLTEHTEAYHGVNWHPSVLKRAEDQMEFQGKPRKAIKNNHIAWPVEFGS
jgi:hypothetical protein